MSTNNNLPPLLMATLLFKAIDYFNSKQPNAFPAFDLAPAQNVPPDISQHFKLPPLPLTPNNSPITVSTMTFEGGEFVTDGENGENAGEISAIVRIIDNGDGDPEIAVHINSEPMAFTTSQVADGLSIEVIYQGRNATFGPFILDGESDSFGFTLHQHPDPSQNYFVIFGPYDAVAPGSGHASDDSDDNWSDEDGGGNGFDPDGDGASVGGAAGAEPDYYD